MKSPLRARPCPALRWIWGVLLLPVVAAAAGAPREIVYKRVGDAALKLHVFGEAGASGPRRPGIVFFFAGGWKTGSPEQFFKQCEHLAARGMIAVSAEYRIASVHQTSPREAVQDAKSSVRYLRRHADALGLDPARLAVGGGSSGGHLAAACAFLAGFNEPGEPLEPSCRPDALVLFNPVIDTGPGEKGGYGHSRVQG